MKKPEIRLLTADEIECRVGIINEKGASLLLYKDARVDQKMLDEIYGVFGWKRSHQCIDGQMFCTVEVWDVEKGQWISKQDVGTESKTEQIKGLVSDSFKRACFNIGIGRELYTAPFIWIPASKMGIFQKSDERNRPRYYTNDRFSVKEISYGDRREITALTIVNDRGTVVYRIGSNETAENVSQNPAGRKNTQPAPKAVEIMQAETTKISIEQLSVLYGELQRTGIELGKVLDRYGIGDISEMTPDIYTKAMRSLKRTKNAA